jgi:hypothetical protein
MKSNAMNSNVMKTPRTEVHIRSAVQKTTKAEKLVEKTEKLIMIK